MSIWPILRSLFVPSSERYTLSFLRARQARALSPCCRWQRSLSPVTKEIDMSATKVDAMDDAAAACLPHLADVVRSTRTGARVKTPAYKAGVAVHEGASVVSKTDQDRLYFERTAKRLYQLGSD